MAGTSAGAKKGWAQRRRHGASGVMTRSGLREAAGLFKDYGITTRREKRRFVALASRVIRAQGGALSYYGVKNVAEAAKSYSSRRDLIAGVKRDRSTRAVLAAYERARRRGTR